MRQPPRSTPALLLEECCEDQATIPAAPEMKQKDCPPTKPEQDDCDISATEETVSTASEMMEESSQPIGVRRSSFKSCSSSYKSCSSTEEKRVSFDSITIHYHSVSLGDSPSVKNGPPLALTWQRLGSRTYSNLEKYEAIRPQGRKTHKMRMRSSRREKVLRRAGVSQEEIDTCIAEIRVLQYEMETCEDDQVVRSSYDEEEAFDDHPDTDSSFSWLDMICSA
mmetsp:Transcript_10698/g.29487  ORF Transcript_10698/g.29487 Transcript_10698/m.29487 type:complete len:223 (+) Transcript_10698:66-734(+)